MRSCNHFLHEMVTFIQINKIYPDQQDFKSTTEAKGFLILAFFLSLLLNDIL